MFISNDSRQRDLRKRLAVWEPLIGRTATELQLSSYWWGQRGFLAAIVWVIVNCALLATSFTGAPVAIAAALAWPFMLFAFTRATRLSIQASKEAGRVVGTSPKARPPVNSVQAFSRWRQNDKYSDSSSYGSRG